LKKTDPHLPPRAISDESSAIVLLANIIWKCEFYAYAKIALRTKSHVVVQSQNIGDFERHLDNGGLQDLGLRASLSH
jgi:hypothetical protein